MYCEAIHDVLKCVRYCGEPKMKLVSIVGLGMLVLWGAENEACQYCGVRDVSNVGLEMLVLWGIHTVNTRL